MTAPLSHGYRRAPNRQNEGAPTNFDVVPRRASHWSGISSLRTVLTSATHAANILESAPKQTNKRSTYKIGF